ncbi:unnamed protein product [Protopolystoma xenopodis]|uniref:Uncharacterized protein n=1 Tax=Protopolystoma xenopodis TaxID=117903 RepID=A0A3S5A5T4_9PLAT|nr:unnamed protein product [Protopolystoma xenopodis]
MWRRHGVARAVCVVCVNTPPSVWSRRRDARKLIAKVRFGLLALLGGRVVRPEYVLKQLVTSLVTGGQCEYKFGISQQQTEKLAIECDEERKAMLRQHKVFAQPVCKQHFVRGVPHSPQQTWRYTEPEHHFQANTKEISALGTRVWGAWFRLPEYLQMSLPFTPHTQKARIALVGL